MEDFHSATKLRTDVKEAKFSSKGNTFWSQQVNRSKDSEQKGWSENSFFIKLPQIGSDVSLALVFVHFSLIFSPVRWPWSRRPPQHPSLSAAYGPSRTHPEGAFVKFTSRTAKASRSVFTVTIYDNHLHIVCTSIGMFFSSSVDRVSVNSNAQKAQASQPLAARIRAASSPTPLVAPVMIATSHLLASVGNKLKTFTRKKTAKKPTGSGSSSGSSSSSFHVSLFCFFSFAFLSKLQNLQNQRAMAFPLASLRISGVRIDKDAAWSKVKKTVSCKLQKWVKQKAERDIWNVSQVRSQRHIPNTFVNS